MIYLYVVLGFVYLGTTVIDIVLKRKKLRLELELEQRLRGFTYNELTDVVSMGQVRISGSMIRYMADEANSGDTFTIVQKGDGVLLLQITRSNEHDHVKKMIEDTLGKGSL